MPWRRKTLNGFVEGYHTSQKRADHFLNKVRNSTLAHLSYDCTHISLHGNILGDNAAWTFLHGYKTGLTILNRSQIHCIPLQNIYPILKSCSEANYFTVIKVIPMYMLSKRK